jgi:hypothetical protein
MNLPVLTHHYYGDGYEEDIAAESKQTNYHLLTGLFQFDS